METITTTNDYLLETTTNDPSTATYSPTLLRTAADILSDAGRLSVDHQDSHQITFEIPSHSDLERIQHLDSFSTLMRRLGNTVYNMGPDHDTTSLGLQQAVAMSADGHPITSEQISKSAVLDLADLNSSGGGLERFFQGADMHSIINYLWIGVVTSLVILSVIFILFSCYFYRKFREWKKCNKDIRAHMNNDLYPGGNSASCDTLLSTHQSGDLAYFQKESPPCYTIATGLPSYDEALHHHHHNHQQSQQQHHHQEHFSFGLKFMYPELAAVNHPIFSVTNNNNHNNSSSNWEKHDLTIKSRGDHHQQQHHQHHYQQQQQQQQQQPMNLQKLSKATASVLHAAPPAYNVSADVEGRLEGGPCVRETGCCRIDLSEATTTTTTRITSSSSSSPTAINAESNNIDENNEAAAAAAAAAATPVVVVVA